MLANGNEFTTVFGRNLVAELSKFVHRPYLVVTMADLWPQFRDSFDKNLAGTHFVNTIDGDELNRQLAIFPICNSVIGLGGGQAIDVAKFIAWSRRLPLFQVPTATTVDAPFGHRAGLRFSGHVRYVGWAVPEAIYIDLDVIGRAPPRLNRSGIAEVLCFHTARADWQLAHIRGRTEPQWPYDQHLVDAADEVLKNVLAHVDDIRAVNEVGIRTLASAMRWAGAAFHNAGWNPRPIEGIEHFVFYALEHFTGKKFIHGQPVCLGIVVGALLHDDRAEEMLSTIHRAGVDIRPEAMGITWGDVEYALLGLKTFVQEAGLWYGIANEAEISPHFVVELRNRIRAYFGE